MLLYVFIIFLVFMVFLSYHLSDKDIMSAPVVLCIGFLLAAIMCVPYKTKWYFDMHVETLMVLVLGVISFFGGYFCLIKKERTLSAEKNTLPYIEISWEKTLLFVAIQLFAIYESYAYIDIVANLFGMTENFAMKIVAYRLSVVANNGMLDIPPIPKLLAYPRTFSYMGGLLFVYKLAADRLNYKKWDKKCLLVCVGTLTLSLMEGSRGAILIHIVIPYITFYYVLKMRQTGWKQNFIKWSNIVKVFVSAFAGMIIFFTSLTLVGRGSDIEFNSIGNIIEESTEQLSVYMGAELKLLDIYITDEYHPPKNTFVGEYTFDGFYGWLNKKIGKNVVDDDFGFRTVNGIFLGNVYTMFRPYYADGGMLGVIIFSMIMGMFFSHVYSRIKVNAFYNEYGIDPYLLIYGYIYYAVLLSFFSNWFYKEWSIVILQNLISYFFITRLFFTRKEI